MVTRAAALLLSLFALAVPLTLAAQVSPPAGATGAPGDPPPAGGDEAAQRTIFGPTHRLTIVVGAILVVVALGLFVAGIRRGPRAAGRASRRRGEPVARGRDDRAA
jgi:hypothetical protein